MFIRRVWPASSVARTGLPDPLRLRRDMDRLFDMLWSGESPAPGVFPPMNVTHEGDRYYVRAELPGIRPEDLQIAVERNKLSVSGKREIPEEGKGPGAGSGPEAGKGPGAGNGPEAGKGVSYHRRERAGGSFSRSLTLPDELNADGVEADYRDGVLTIVLPKAEAAKARQIKVKAG